MRAQGLARVLAVVAFVPLVITPAIVNAVPAVAAFVVIVRVAPALGPKAIGPLNVKFRVPP